MGTALAAHWNSGSSSTSCLVILKALMELSPLGQGQSLSLTAAGSQLNWLLSRYPGFRLSVPSHSWPSFLPPESGSRVLRWGTGLSPCVLMEQWPVGARWKPWALGWARADDSSFLYNLVSRGTATKPRPSEQSPVSLNHLCSQRALFKLTHSQSMGRVQGVESCYEI